MLVLLASCYLLIGLAFGLWLATLPRLEGAKWADPGKLSNIRDNGLLYLAGCLAVGVCLWFPGLWVIGFMWGGNKFGEAWDARTAVKKPPRSVP